MVEISLSGSGEGPGASKRPGLLDFSLKEPIYFEQKREHVNHMVDLGLVSSPPPRRRRPRGRLEGFSLFSVSPRYRSLALALALGKKSQRTGSCRTAIQKVLLRR
jgi:hypothetical protein